MKTIYGLTSVIFILLSFNTIAETIIEPKLISDGNVGPLLKYADNLDSSYLELSFDYLKNYNLNINSDFPKNSSSLNLYGRTNTSSLFDIELFGFQLTKESEGQFQFANKDYRSNQPIYGSFNLYLPLLQDTAFCEPLTKDILFESFVKDTDKKEIKSRFMPICHGYSQLFPPKLTIAANVDYNRISSDGPFSLSRGPNSFNDFSTSLYLRYHHWFSHPILSDGKSYSDIMFDIGSSISTTKDNDVNDSEIFAAFKFRKSVTFEKHVYLDGEFETNIIYRKLGFENKNDADIKILELLYRNKFNKSFDSTYFEISTGVVDDKVTLPSDTSTFVLLRIVHVLDGNNYKIKMNSYYNSRYTINGRLWY